MAAIFSSKGFGEGLGNPVPGVSCEDKTKEWQMELLMEKLRSKSGQFKSFVELAKALRMSLLEKRYPCDNVERNQLQKCLDTLQHSIKVTSLQGMVERLESVTRQLGLKFMAGPSGLELFISSDMFYLEVVLEATGGVKDVKIHHEGKVEQQSCEELVSCLSRGDFADFTSQLEGLAAIYQLNAEKKVKCKAFSALQSLEADLGSLASVQMMIKEPFNLVHKSPVGIVEKRRGGHAMKLTYLVSPYDLLDAKTGSAIPLTVSEVVQRQLGYSALVCMEGSIAHKLPISPLITISRGSNGKSSPVYTPLSAANSCTLPACFVLRLSKPLPMCLALVKKVTQLTELECGDVSSPHPLLSLIAQHASAGQQDTHKGLFVSLPDQQHCYFMTETKGLEGILVTSIPFTHPSHVPQILVFLRQQALLNTLISSCIRPAARQDLETMIMFEVSALSWQHLSISLEHPQEETLATAELDLSDIGSVKCAVFGAGLTSGEAASHHATKVLQRSLSIPVTMRALIRSWQTHAGRSTTLPNSATSSGDPGSQGPDFDLSRVKTEPERPSYNGESTEPSFQPPSDSSSFMVMGDKKSRKRKGVSTETWPSKRKSEEDCEILVESSSEDSTTADRQSEDEVILDIDDVEERPRKQKKEKPSILLELDNKTSIPPSVSITPIGTPTFNSVLTGMGLERRPGIEIIPINSTPSPALPSSITITPIQGKPIDRDRKRPREDKSRLDKKRKRKREDGSDALNKPVSVSIKPTERSDSKSVGGSGKPSMSALKSAASSPNKDSSKLRTQSKDKDRKDTPKLKSSSIKTKPSESNEAAVASGASLPQARNRKGSLSAIVDKLKSAQHCGPEGEIKPNSTPKTPGEYMVKPSSDGMRITINKTRTKDSKGTKSSSVSSSQQGSGSPKTHTGLKPGVNSGPASKKPHTLAPVKNSGSKMGSGKLPMGPKPSSPIPGVLSKNNKGLGSPKPGERRDKMRPLKPGDKSPAVKGKASPVLELEGYKMLSQHAKIEPSSVVEGLIKSLDTKFQIPKLSARNQEPDAKKVDKTDSINKVVDPSGKTDQKYSAKTMEDKTAKPITVMAPTPTSKSSPPIGSGLKTSPPMGASLKASPPIGSGLKASPPIGSGLKASPPVGSGLKASPPIGASLKVNPPIGVGKMDEPSMSIPSVSAATDDKQGKDDTSSKVDPNKCFTEPIALPIKVPSVKPDEPRKLLLTSEFGGGRPTPTTPQEAAEILLDFSASSAKPECSVPERALAAAAPPRRNTPPLPNAFPHSPAVTMVTIVKSPAPSPHSNPSPCLTDDELMDEALVGLGKS